MFNDSGCTNKLAEDNVAWWRTRSNIVDIKNDMNAYGSLAKNCTGDPKQNEFCNPNGCFLFEERVVWLDANDNSTLISDNNGIAVWKDKSPYQNDFRYLIEKLLGSTLAIIMYDIYNLIYNKCLCEVQER